MKVNCVICGELALQTQEVSAAPCGHTFHTLCIVQWLERSKSCPQCRSKVTERTLNKLFFDPGCTDVETDPDALLQQIDNLKFQVKLKEQEVKKVSDENDILKVQAVALREEFKGMEKRLKDRDTTILALKSQLQNVDRVTAEAKKAKEKAKTLVQELNLLKGVEKMLVGTNEEVETIMQSNSVSSLKSLATFISVLKRELSRASEDKSKLRAEVATVTRRCKEATSVARSLQEEVDSLTTTVKHLEQDNESLEKDTAGLRKKVQALEQAITSPSDDMRNSALHRLLSESPAPELLKRLHSANLSDCVTPEVVQKKKRTTSESESRTSDVMTEPARTAAEEKLAAEATDLTHPSLTETTKLSSSTITPVRPLSDSLNITKGAKGHHHRLFAKPNNSSSSAVGRGRKMVGVSVGYDGMGGHHKFDEFPKPRPASLLLASRKKYVTKKVDGGGRGGGGGSGSIRAGHSKVIQDYFKNTFDHNLD